MKNKHDCEWLCANALMMNLVLQAFWYILSHSLIFELFDCQFFSNVWLTLSDSFTFGYLVSVSDMSPFLCRLHYFLRRWFSKGRISSLAWQLLPDFIVMFFESQVHFYALEHEHRYIRSFLFFYQMLCFEFVRCHTIIDICISKSTYKYNEEQNFDSKQHPTYLLKRLEK